MPMVYRVTKIYFTESRLFDNICRGIRSNGYCVLDVAATLFLPIPRLQLLPLARQLPYGYDLVDTQVSRHVVVGLVLGTHHHAFPRVELSDQVVVEGAIGILHKRNVFNGLCGA